MGICTNLISARVVAVEMFRDFLCWSVGVVVGVNARLVPRFIADLKHVLKVDHPLPHILICYISIFLLFLLHTF